MAENQKPDGEQQLPNVILTGILPADSKAAQDQSKIINDEIKLPPKIESQPEENKNQDDSANFDFSFNFHSKPGDKDPLGREIIEVYFSSDGKYFIYHIGDYSLQIVAVDGTPISKNAKANGIYMRILDYLASNSELKKKYTRSLAFAVKTFYDGDIDVAIHSLESTLENITRSLKRKAESAYIGGALILVLIAPIAYFITYRVGLVYQAEGLNALGQMIFCAVVFSALGGFLSVTLNVRNLDVDVQNSFRTIMFYGAQRIIIAMISGIFIYFLIASKIFLAFFEDIQNNNIYYVAFFLCGFSERLVPNLMLNFEEKGFFDVKEKSK